MNKSLKFVAVVFASVRVIIYFRASLQILKPVGESRYI